MAGKAHPAYGDNQKMNMADTCLTLPRRVPEQNTFVGTGYRMGMELKKAPASSASSLSIYQGIDKKRETSRLTDRLDYFARLGENWNGYGASPLPDTVIRRARNLVDHLPEKAKVFPTAQNSIQFELDYQPGTYLEIEVFPDSYAILFESDSTREEKDQVNHEIVMERIKAYDARRILP